MQGHVQLAHQIQVREELDLRAVLRARVRLDLPGQPFRLGQRADDVLHRLDGLGSRPDDDLPVLRVQQQRRLFRQIQQPPVRGDHQGDLERLRQDRHVGMLPALQQHEARRPFRRQFQDVRRQEFFGDDDLARVVRARAFERRRRQVVEQPVAQILHVEHLLAQRRIGAVREQIRIAAHFVQNRDPGIFSAADLRADLPGKRVVLQHQHVRAENHGGRIVDLVLQPPLQVQQLPFRQRQGAVEIRFREPHGTRRAFLFVEQILADARGQPHSHHVGRALPAHAMGSGTEIGIRRGARRRRRFLLRSADFQEQMGVLDHAGQLGRDDLQGLDVVRGEIIPLGILHGDHADRIHLAQDGHRQERDEPLLVAAGNVLVVGIVRGARFADGPHFLEGHAGDAFADLQPQPADQLRIQALVGAQDQLLRVGFEQENRTDGRPHVPGHGGNRFRQERIEPRLEIEQADQLADVAHQRDVVLLEIAHVPFISGRNRRGRRQGLTSFPKKVPSPAFLFLLPDGVTVAQQPLELFV